MISLIKKNVPLANLTSWKVGGQAEYFGAPSTNEELRKIFEWAKKESHKISILGQGSNVLVSDQGVPGLVIHMDNFNQILEVNSDQDQFKIHCQSGVLKSDLLKIFLKNRLAPALFLAGLPGDVGGGVVMNAGIGQKETPREFCEIVDSIEVLRWSGDSSEYVQFSGKELGWEYRKSKGWQPGIISSVVIGWENRPDEGVLKMVREANSRRKKTQPLNLPSCGSVFKNPEGHFSGKLIQEAGLKGYSLGGAQVSEKHGNFIVNTGGATATEIHNVMTHVQKVILDKFNIQLTNEVVYMGQW